MKIHTAAESAAVKAAFARRSAALARFAVWQARHFYNSAPADALSAATWLYDLLPAGSRVRPIQTAGVKALHRALSRLARPL